MLLDVETQPGTRRFSGTSSPGDFTFTSTSRVVTNTAGRDLTVMAVQYVGQAMVASSGRNQGRIEVRSGWGLSSSVDRLLVWRHGINFDQGDYINVSPIQQRQYFTQSDASTTATQVIVPPTGISIPVLAPGQTAYFSTQVRWTSDLWNQYVVGFDSQDYADFPYTRTWLLGFPV